MTYYTICLFSCYCMRCVYFRLYQSEIHQNLTCAYFLPSMGTYFIHTNFKQSFRCRKTFCVH